MGFPEWKGEAVAGLSLHRPVVLAARLDFLPFVALYMGWAVTCSTSEIPRLFEIFGAVVLVVLHLLVFLMQYWSLAVRVAVGHRTMKSIGEKDEAEISEGKIRVRAIPPPHRGKEDFSTLQIDNGRIYFRFQMLTYEYNRETGCFEQVSSARFSYKRKPKTSLRDTAPSATKTAPSTRQPSSQALR